jgi:predicted glycogen debranching enzyme
MENGSLLSREWLVTNGLGGYAAGTVSGVASRRHHALLTAALPKPFGRYVMFNHLSETVQFTGDKFYSIGGAESAVRAFEAPGPQQFLDFSLEWGLPVWRYHIAGVSIEKRILMPYRQNSVYIRYQLLSAGVSVSLKLRPALNFRPHDTPVGRVDADAYRLLVNNDRYEIEGPGSVFPLRLFLYGRKATLIPETEIQRGVLYRIEDQRGEQTQGELWSPGYVQAELSQDNGVALIASAEDWEKILVLKPQEAQTADMQRRRRLLSIVAPEARTNPIQQLVFAADQFITVPVDRTEDAVRAHAAGEEARTIIAGYHWFTDWGRDTMISLDGLLSLPGD